MKLNETPCPKCGAEPPTLIIEERFHAKPMGTYSLAGGQVKTSGWMLPTLMCKNCDLHIAGKYDEDGRHATFG